MLIEKEKGHVGLSVSLTGTWSVSAGTVLGDHTRDLGHTSFCPFCPSVLSPVCLSVGMLLSGRRPCFLKMIPSFYVSFKRACDWK